MPRSRGVKAKVIRKSWRNRFIGSPLLRFLCTCSFGVESVDGVPFRLSIAEILEELIEKSL